MSAAPARLASLAGPAPAPAALVAALAVAALTGCDEQKPPGGAEPPSRVNAAKTAARKGASTEAFCDAHFAAGAGPALAWPALAAGADVPAPPAAPAGAWRWINVWATWCKPCVEEMPRLQRWRDELARAGRRLELAFVSVDETDAEIAAFRKRHPGAPASARLADPATGPAWYRALGLTGEPPIPLHFFVDAQGRVRCARAGGVGEQDYAIVEQLVSE